MRRWILLLAGTLVVPMAVLGQPGADYPHGDLDEDCGLCHSSDRWKPLALRADFDHETYGFALEGSHRDLFCGFCHTSLDFAATEASCAQCHTDVHNGELGDDCGECHGLDSFTDVADQLRMHRLASFPLTDTHLTVDCEACHPPAPQGTATFRLTDASCAACHLAEYQSTSAPDHAIAEFSTECEICHRPTDWHDGYFNHEVLAGGGSCVECHRDDYDSTTEPNHTDLGFSLDCDACHNTRGWTGANFEHESFFPIRPSRHRAECSRCHIVPSNYVTFSCLGCHPHDDRAETDSRHRDELNYVYESVACFDCHPRGQSE